MANVLKYKTSQPTKRALRKGNIVLGIGEEGYGPTSTTGYVNGITPPDGGYVVYILSSNNDPAIYVAYNDNDLMAIARTLGGGDLTPLEAKNYLNSRSNTWVLDSIPDNTITDGLMLHLDAGNQSSFIDNQPTTNYGPDDFGNWEVQSHPFNASLGPAERIATGKTYKGQPTYNCRTVVGGINYGLVKEVSGLRTAAGSGGTVTMSCMVRNNNGTAYNMYAYIGSWSLYGSPISIPANSDWMKVEWTVNQSSMYYDRVAFHPYTNNASVYLEMTMPMVEVNVNSASDFVSGSRSQNTTIYDLSGNGNDGTLANGPTFNSNGYITFDGTDDYVDVNGFGWTPTSFSVVWLTNPTNMFNYNQVVGANNGWGAFNFHTTVDGGVYVGTDVVNRLTPTNIPAGTLVLNQWQMFCFTYNGTVGAFYKDGNLIASKTMNSSTAWGGLRIGYNSSSTIDGSLGLFKVYDRALSDSELLQNYYGGPIVTDGLIFAIDASNLVSYESGSTTVYNLTGSESGSLVNGVEYDSNKGGAWSFDGADDYIGITGVQTPSFSISAWINLSELDRFHGIMGRASSIFTNTSYAFRVKNSNELSISLSNSGTSAAPYFELASTTTLQSSTWYHVAVTFNKPNVTLYINGNIDVTGTFNYDLYNSTSNSIIGGYTYGNGLNYLMKGQILNLQFYNRALSEEEITQNYNAQKARYYNYYNYYNGLLTGLESYWKLDEASGTIVDSHGSNDGTATGVTYGATGIINDCLDFDGTGDYVDIGDVADFEFERTDTFSLAAWFKASSTGTGPHSILSKQDDTDGWNFYRHGSSGSYRLYFNMIDAGGGQILVASVPTYNDTDWHYFVVTNDGSGGASGIKMYVDGSLVSDTDIVDTLSTSIGANAYKVNIGARNNTNLVMDGLLDEVGIWSRELSSTDVMNLYNNGSGLAYGDFTT